MTTCNPLLSFKKIISDVENLDVKFMGSVYLLDVLKEYDKKNNSKNVLLISHELGLSGAPVAVYYMAKYLMSIGYCTVIISPTDGNLTTAICKDNIPVIIYAQLYQCDFINTYSKLFDFIVANTVITAPVISMLSGSEVPVLWWIHEAKLSYSYKGIVDKMPDEIGDNIHVYCVGEYAKKALLCSFPKYQAGSLLYYLPKYEKYLFPERFADDKDNKKVVFCVIGVVDIRKGQDILAEVISSIPSNYLKKAFFIFVGKINKSSPTGVKTKLLCGKFPCSAVHVDEIQQEFIKKIYQEIDCLICTSRDDPMPIVVSEAFMNEKIVITSEHTGSASLITEGVNGFIYKNNDCDELSMKIKYVIDNISSLDSMRKAAGEIYQNNFSKEAFENCMDKVIERMMLTKKK
jgi:glycosyltransferase involved in cell wall biosynthesis